MKNTFLKFALILGCAGLTSAVKANTYTFDTSSGDSSEVVFVTSAGQLQITLKNLQVNPQSVSDCLSALGFGVSAGTSASLNTSSGLERTIAADGSFTDGSTVATGWVLSGSVSSLLLDDLTGTGHAGPAHTVIGAPGGATYATGGSGSISGNGPHNPFLFGDVTFTLDITGLTDSSTVGNVVFQFGTTDGQGLVRGTPKVPSVPDGGTTSMLLGSALVGLQIFRRRIARL
jgi:hypothetical protein